MCCNLQLIFASEDACLFSCPRQQSGQTACGNCEPSSWAGGRKPGRAPAYVQHDKRRSRRRVDSHCVFLFAVCSSKSCREGINPWDKWGFNGGWGWTILSHGATGPRGWVLSLSAWIESPEHWVAWLRAAWLRSLADPQNWRHTLLSSGRTEGLSLVLHWDTVALLSQGAAIHLEHFYYYFLYHWGYFVCCFSARCLHN